MHSEGLAEVVVGHYHFLGTDEGFDDVLWHRMLCVPSHGIVHALGDHYPNDDYRFGPRKEGQC